MAGIDPNARKKYRKLYTPDSAAVRELRLACKANDSQRVRMLLDGDSTSAADATACLTETRKNLSLMRLLLEHGGDPAACAGTYYMAQSFDLIKLLVEFGYDIAINGHNVLQEYATSREHIDWLLDHGVDITQTDTVRTDDGSRPGQCRDFSLKHLNNVSAASDIALFDHLVARGADPHRSMALHCAAKCKDPSKTTAMIEHLLDVHHMDIEANNEDLRDYFHASGDSGSPLNCAVYYQNLSAVQTLLQRGANPERAIYQTIKNVLTQSWLPALGPLLDAGANPDHAFAVAVDDLNFEAAKICLEKGADPTLVLRKQRRKADLKATGCFDRQRDADEGDGGNSTDDDDEDVQLESERRAMREFVSLAASGPFGLSEPDQQSRL